MDDTVRCWWIGRSTKTPLHRRLLPFWGAPSGHPRCTGVALTKSREGFLRELVAHGEKNHLPIRVAVTAAAVETLGALPLIDPRLNGSVGRGDLCEVQRSVCLDAERRAAACAQSLASQWKSISTWIRGHPVEHGGE